MEEVKRKITLEDILSLQKMMNFDDIPQQDRTIVMTHRQYENYLFTFKHKNRLKFIMHLIGKNKNK